jgi:hypothetical protein
LTPPPLEHADVLNGWSLITLTCGIKKKKEFKNIFFLYIHKLFSIFFLI